MGVGVKVRVVLEANEHRLSQGGRREPLVVAVEGW